MATWSVWKNRLTDPDSFKRFLDATEERLGPLDVLVNNAGIMVVAPFLEEEESLTRREIDMRPTRRPRTSSVGF